MATSGYISWYWKSDIMGNMPPGLRLKWETVSQIIYSNSTRIRWTYELYWPEDRKETTVRTESQVIIYDKTYNVNYSSLNIKPGWNTLKSSLQDIPHEIDGTRTFNYGFMETLDSDKPIKSGTDTLEKINRGAYITSFPSSFNDEAKPSIMYNNLSAEKVSDIQVCIATEPPVSTESSKAIIPYRSVANPSAVSGLYTFELTDAERKELRKYVIAADRRPLRFYIRTIIDGLTILDYKKSIITLVNYKPEITATIEDVNARTLELTGDKYKFIRYRSNAYFTTKTVIKKEAEYERMSAECLGGKKYENVISGTFTEVDGATIIQSGTSVFDNPKLVFNFSVYDNRGNSGHDTIYRDVIPYIEPTNNLTLGKLEITTAGTYNAQLTFTVSGKYYNGSFGAKSNTMELEYRVVDDDGNDVFMDAEGKVWVPLGTIKPTITDGENYKYSYTIKGLDYRKGYTVYVNVIDELTPEVISAKSVAAIPIFDWGKEDFEHHTVVKFDKNIVMNTNNTSIRGTGADGSDYHLLGLNSLNNTIVGWTGYDKSNGSTSVYGKDVYLTAKEKVLINGREYGAQKVLWQHASGSFMNASQTINLSEAISKQPNGIVLVFSLYRDGAGEDVSINSFFVSKKEVELLPGAPHTFIMMINSGFSTIGAKYLYINDTSITGHDTNGTDGTNNNFNFANRSFVLRYVIGV